MRQQGGGATARGGWAALCVLPRLLWAIGRPRHWRAPHGVEMAGWQGCAKREAVSRGGRAHRRDLEKLAVKVLEDLKDSLPLALAKGPLTRKLERLSERREEKLEKEALRPVGRATRERREHAARAGRAGRGGMCAAVRRAGLAGHATTRDRRDVRRCGRAVRIVATHNETETSDLGEHGIDDWEEHRRQLMLAVVHLRVSGGVSSPGDD